LSYAKAKKQLGWAPKVGLAQGIKATADHFRRAATA
jgi:nucleoside-diphosphate-sugar epimerase